VTELQLLLHAIDQAYDRKSWHGTNLRGSIRRITLEQAAWRPGRGRHNIWELVAHCAYWKYAVWRRLSGAARGAFALKGSNWFERSESMADSEWRADVALLDRTHREMRGAIDALSPRDLSYTPPGSKVSNVALVSGIAAHDLYHAGQIQLIKKLAREMGEGGKAGTGGSKGVRS
jgi:hypothetical protein